MFSRIIDMEPPSGRPYLAEFSQENTTMVRSPNNQDSPNKTKCSKLNSKSISTPQKKRTQSES